MPATVLWTAVVIVHIARGLDWVHYAGRWLGSEAVVVPRLDVLLAHLSRLGVAALISAGLVGAGRVCLAALSYEPGTRFEEATISFAMGYGLVGTALLCIGVAGAWSPAMFKTMSAALLACACCSAALFARRQYEPCPGLEPESKALISCAVAGTAFVCLYLLRYALVPETFYDALVYHLALPAQYLLRGRIFPTPANSYSGIPALPQMIFGLCLFWEHWGVCAGIMHWSMLPWTCAAVYCVSQRLKRPVGGLIAAAVVTCTPVVIGEAFRVSVGLEWAFMQACCLCATLALADDDRGSRWGRAIVAGSLLGFTMATKYPAWTVPLAILALLWAARGREADMVPASRRITLGAFLAAALAAAAVLAPWVLKNQAFFRNPLYPFFQERFAAAGTPQPDWRQLSAAGTDPRALLTLRGLARYLAHPWRFLKPPDDVTETIGPVYLALLPAVLLLPLDRRARMLGLFALAAWVPLSLLSDLPRLFIAHLVAVALFIGYAIEGLGGPWKRRARIAALFLSALTALGWMIMDANRDKLAVYAGDKTFEDYLAHTTVSYPTPPYAGYDYLNTQTPEDARVAVYGDARGLYLRRRALISSSDQPSELERWADQSSTVSDLLGKFREAKVSYVLVNLAELSRQHRAPRVSPKGLRVLDAFWKRYTVRSFGVIDPRDRWLGVYRILADAESRQPHQTDDLFAPFLK